MALQQLSKKITTLALLLLNAKEVIFFLSYAAMPCFSTFIDLLLCSRKALIGEINMLI